MFISKEKANEIYNMLAQLEDDNQYDVVGIRFEDKGRTVGDICERSKDNPDREDEREYPDYGTSEYDDMPELPGTCAWRKRFMDTDRWSRYLKENGMNYGRKHAYIIGGYEGSYNNYSPDDGEVLIDDAVVISVIQ